MITENIKRESKFTHLASILRFIHPADSGFEKAQFLGDLVNTEQKERQAFLNLTGFMRTYAQREQQHWWQQHNALPIKKSKRVEIYESRLQLTLSITPKETFLLWDIRSESWDLQQYYRILPGLKQTENNLCLAQISVRNQVDLLLHFHYGSPTLD